MSEKISVREACRMRMSIDGTDAQALEHALTITEGERDALRDALAEARSALAHVDGYYYAGDIKKIDAALAMCEEKGKEKV
jgi:hypothetical protein